MTLLSKQDAFDITGNFTKMCACTAQYTRILYRVQCEVVSYIRQKILNSIHSMNHNCHFSTAHKIIAILKKFT